nr:LCP family protein [Streptomyces sp. ERV7]
MAGSHKAGNARGGSRKGAVGAPPAGRRRRGRLRLVLALLVSLLVLAVAGLGWIYFELNGDIRTFDDGGVSGDRPAASAKGQNVLVIGSDSRAGDNVQYGHGSGDIGRSDTAFLMHVHADHKHATAISLPRDTLVDVPPCKLPNGTWTTTRHNVMFNSAFSVGDTARGNPACTQNTVEKLTGLRVDHTVVVDFAGFAKMTEAVGGVQVCVPKDIYEGDLNPNRHAHGERLFTKGVQEVSGQKALDYVRIRHGIGDGSDIGRIQRQQAFIAGLMKKVKQQGLDPTTLLPLAKAATRSLTVDPGLGSADKLISFAMSMKNIDLHNTKFVTLPWRYEGARVAIVRPQADALFAALRADRTVDGKDAGGEQKAPSPSATERGGARRRAASNMRASRDSLRPCPMVSGTRRNGPTASAP